MKPREQAVQELEENGYRFERHGANHDIWYNPTLRCSITLKRHKFDENTLRYIIQEMERNRRGRG